MIIFRLCRLIVHIALQIKGRIIFGRNAGILGNFTVVNPLNVTIGTSCGINHAVFILGNHKVKIENNVVLSARVMLIDSGLDLVGFAGKEFPAHFSGFCENRRWRMNWCWGNSSAWGEDWKKKCCRRWQRGHQRCGALHGSGRKSSQTDWAN